jgi:hypothetical protein
MDVKKSLSSSVNITLVALGNPVAGSVKAKAVGSAANAIR